MRKMLVSDFDHTLYINDEGLLENISAINKFRSEGNLFVIATGRSYNDLKKVLDEVTKEKFYDYLILNHGTVILDSNDLIINEEYIDDSVVEQVCAIAKKYSDYIYEDVLYSADKKGVTIGEESVVKVLFEIDELYHDKATALYSEVMDKYGEDLSAAFLKWGHYEEVEFMPKGVDKANKINFLINRENILQNNIFTIGDEINDKRMLEDYNGACMKDSVPEVLDLNLKKYSSVSDFVLEIR